MFARFSPASRRVLRAAEQECRNHNHYYVGSEHVLLALLEEQDEAINATLAERDIKTSELHAVLRRALGTGEDRQWEGILVTPRVRALVQTAIDDVGNAREIEPLDLFLALSRQDGGLAVDLLARLEVRVST